MNNLIRLVAMMLLTAPAARCAEPVAKQFLRYIYGADGIDLASICHPSDDSWMLRGPTNTNALTALDALRFDTNRTGIVSGVVGADMYFVELRDGRVDPAFNLNGVYLLHRNLVLTFIYSCLTHDQPVLRRLVTDESKVQIVGPKPPSGEMGQYASVIEMIPLVRSSKAPDDLKTKTVTYRVPISDAGLSLTVVKEGGTWKIDTSKTVRVPLEFFFR